MADNEPIEGEIVAAQSDEKRQMIQSRDHPHYGELGWLVPDTIQPNTGQHYFKLSNCQHGVVGCYVLTTDLTNSQELVAPEKSTNSTTIDPYKYNDITVGKLIEAFEMSYNVSEACQHAGIDRGTFYNWIKDIEGFEAKMEEAKSMPLRLAKGVIKTALKANDVNTAKWYVERRDPEFKPKAEIDNNIGIQETRKKIGDFLDDDDSADDGSEQSAAADATSQGEEVAPTPPDIS